MNIVSKLTLKHLLENKKRSIVTILGIATSTALISAILLGVFSFFSFFGQISILTSGYAHAAFEEVSEEQYKGLLQDDALKTVGLRALEEEKTGIRLINDQPDRFRIGNIDHANQASYEMRVICDYEGELPKNSSEIAVEEAFLKENNLDLKVGDTLTFEQGYRYMENDEEGFYYLGGNYRSEEKFEAKSVDTCIITAILHGNRPTKDWDILRGLDDGYYPEQEDAEVSMMLAKCDTSSIKQIKNLVKKYGIQKYEYNSEYFISIFALEGSSGAYSEMFVFLGVALAIVIATSVVLIFNSIGMSLTERMRYLGMLASVGATSRQKRFSIYYEGFILGLIGIPLGLLMGYIGTKITLAILGSKILAADILAGAEGMRGTIPIVCEPHVVALIIFFSGLTILISSLIPGLKAARIMPIDALRQSSVIKVKARKLRVNPLIRKIFGYEGELAYKNIKRNGVKGTVITVSIAVSVILFLSINYVCNSVQRANSYDFNIPYSVIASCSLEESDKLREAIVAMDDVEDVYCAYMISFLFQKPSNDPDAVLANTDIANRDYLTDNFKNVDFGAMAVVVIDDQYFDKLLADNGLEKEKYYSGTLRGVLLNDMFHEKKSSEVFNSGILGQSLHYDETEGFPPAVEVADFVEYDSGNFVLDFVPKGSMVVYVPKSVYFEEAAEVIPADKLSLDFGVKTDNPKEVHARIYELLQQDGYHNYYCSDLSNLAEAMDTVTLMLKTAMYGFSTLLTLIAIANIINTISTGVLLRRKEFAMYKSIGMASGGFKKMIRLETLLYGIKALLYGIPISLILSYLMYNSFDSKLYSFDPDYLMYVIVVAVVFAVVGLSMLLSINKIKDDNIIDALKEDAV
ncbi:ABC transporter permease [Butyrivibrio proteoclasticus]|uniref:ABC transporter permease n=1 Tax=Butyrivibrio proteoclasticus TaxID=43305 RepID=UPI000479909E|nr:FtsX-like permease family protein [Butyrivibrio proteoclasticus]